MSSRSEKLRRIGSVALFVVLLGASTLVFPGLTPLTGPPPVILGVSRSVDHGVAILSRARQPYQDVTFSESLKAFIPNFVSLQQGAVLMADAPLRPVLIGQQHAWDYPSVLARATQDHFGWSTGIGGSEIVAFAEDEAHFRAAVSKAGLTLRASDLHPLSPMLAALHSSVRGAHAEVDGWVIPPSRVEGPLLFGPYVDLQPGDYRVHMHVTMMGSPQACRSAGERLKPSIAVTSNFAKSILRPQAPLAAVIAKDDLCSISLDTPFTVPSGGAEKVETPFYGVPVLPMIVDAYSVDVAVPAQAR